MLEGFRREVTVNDLCRREGMKPHSYYAWTKEFMEAGKERLTRDSVRDATRQEIQELKRENGELKQLAADLSLEAYRLKKRPYQCLRPPAVSADERRGEGGGTDQGGFLGSPKNVGSSVSLESLRAPTTGGSGERTIKDLRTMQEAASPGNRLRSVGSQGDARAELPSARRMDHGHPGLLRLRFERLPYLAQRGPGEEP